MSKDVYSHGVNVREFNEQHWEFVRNLEGEEIKEKGYGRGLYRCKHCGAIVDRKKQAFGSRLFICFNSCNGVKYGNSTMVLKGVNDIATTHPYLVQYFINDEAQRYSANSNQKVSLKCPDCGAIKEMILFNLTRRCFSCPVCSDGISYPEKFVSNLLKQLGIEFKKEFSLDDGRTRYDFYLPSCNCIIEVHGEQHYKETNRVGGRTLKEEQLNDKYKHKLAIKKGVRCYIVIDARESSLEWMKDSIMQSQLPILLGFKEDGVDWDVVAIDCEKSLVRQVCVYFSENGGNTKSIGRVFNISYSTVNNYLARGTELGWCEYTDEVKKQNQREAVKRVGSVRGKKVRGTHIKTKATVEFNSIRETERWLFENGLTHSKGANTKISACCNGKRKSAYGYKWEFVV